VNFIKGVGECGEKGSPGSLLGGDIWLGICMVWGFGNRG